MKYSKQLIKVVLFLFIIVSVISFAIPSDAASIWDKRKQSVQDLKEEAKGSEEPVYDEEADEYYEEGLDATSSSSLEPEDIIIPEQYGTIIETHKGTNGKIIIHIQDAHSNYEGQMNEAKILESLIEDYDLNLILGEGHISDEDYKYLREEGVSLEDREEVADGLVKDGYFSGINYLDLATDLSTKIRGIEDKAVYDAHIESLWKIDDFKDVAAEYIDKLIKASDAIKPSIYNQALLALDAKKKDYDEEKIDLLEYYEYLYGEAGKSDIPLYTFPNFQNLVRASELEKKIDMAKVRDGSASDEEMDLYGEYMEATKNLNINDLFKEEPLLEDVLRDALVENQGQKDLLKVSKALSIMKNLLRIKAVPEEYRYFLDSKKDFDPEFWTGFLREKSGESGISMDIPDNHYVIKENLPKIEKFYSIAAEREKVFLEKTNEHLKNENADLAALVAGGFHTPSLTDLLAEAGYSYIVISPKVTTETDDNLYRWALKMDWPE